MKCIKSVMFEFIDDSDTVKRKIVLKELYYHSIYYIFPILLTYFQPQRRVAVIPWLHLQWIFGAGRYLIYRCFKKHL